MSNTIPQLFNSGREEGISLDASYTTEPFNLGANSKVSIDVVIENSGGTSVGTLAFEVANKNEAAHFKAVTFSNGAAEVTSIAVATGTDDSVTAVIDLPVGWVRGVFTFTSGSGGVLDLIAKPAGAGR